MSSTANAILAGILMTGPRDPEVDPREWEARVLENTLDAQSLMSDGSRLYKTVEGIKVYSAVVDAIQKEKKSTRGLVTLKVKPSTYAKDGIEQVRTERTDRPDGLAMAKKIKGLIGHKVLIFKEIEVMANGNKSAVIRHVKDLGEANGTEFGEDED